MEAKVSITTGIHWELDAYISKLCFFCKPFAKWAEKLGFWAKNYLFGSLDLLGLCIGLLHMELIILIKNLGFFIGTRDFGHRSKRNGVSTICMNAY